MRRRLQFLRIRIEPKLLQAVVRARLRSHILKTGEAGLAEFRLVIPSEVFEFTFPPGLILARPDLQGLFILNESAGFLWSLVRQGNPFQTLVSRFREAYGLDEHQAARDISATISFWEQQLLLPSPTSDSTGDGPLTCPDSWHIAENYLINGRIVRVRVSDPQLAVEISPRLESLCSVDTSQPDLEFQVWSQGGRVLLALNSSLISSEENPNAIRAILLQEMVRRTERGREWLAVLHAGACGTDDSCVLLAGKSQSGKTTLCAALMASGFKFYADDSAALGRDDGRISPMPFRMMVREGSWNVLDSRFPEIAASPIVERFGEKVRFLAPRGSQAPVAPGRPKALVFVCYSPGEKTALHPLLPFETLLKLQESGFWVQHDRESIRAFLDWLQSLPAFEFTYSDLDDAISAIRELSDR